MIDGMERRMSRQFTYDVQPSRVVFGSGALSCLDEEAERLGIKRLLVITTPSQAGLGEHVSESLGGRSAMLYPEAVMHTPVPVTEAALEIVRAREIDGFVAIGGGSATGLSKALAYRTGLPQIVIPTTYAGSEVTPILGETKDGLKTTVSDRSILPGTVIYDVDLTLGLPLRMSAVSGLNAIAHAVEALYAKERNPIISLLAQEGIGALAGALRTIVKEPTDVTARTEALYGAWLCGVCLGAVGMSLHHKLCHTLGGSFDLPHAETHAVILPHAMAYNAPAVPEAAAQVATALGAETAAGGLIDLARGIGAPTSLRQLKMAEHDLPRAVEVALSKPYWNPRPIERGPLAAMLANAWAGHDPQEL